MDSFGRHLGGHRGSRSAINRESYEDQNVKDGGSDKWLLSPDQELAK